MESKEQEIIRLMRPVRLTETADGIEADLLMGVLKEEGIAAYKRPLESGGIMNAYMGFSIFGAEILVDEEDYEAAAKLLDEIKFIEDETEEHEEPEHGNITAFIPEMTPDSSPETGLTGKRVFRLFVFVIVAGVLLWAVSVISSFLLVMINTG